MTDDVRRSELKIGAMTAAVVLRLRGIIGSRSTVVRFTES
jgi:hypothetical protein